MSDDDPGTGLKFASIFAFAVVGTCAFLLFLALFLLTLVSIALSISFHPCHCCRRNSSRNPSRNLTRNPSRNHPRNYLRRPSVPSEPPETETVRSGRDPRICDVFITQWYPLYSQPEPLLGKLGLGKRNANHTPNGQKRQRWGGFLVSRIHSINLFHSQSVSYAHVWFLDIQPLSADMASDADAPLSLPGGRDGSPSQHPAPTQIRVSAVILMPALPSSRHVESPSEYALGTSYLSYTSK